MAFTAPDEVGQDIYITDFPFTEASPINLTQNPDRDDMIGAWSQDGQQLAFISSGPCGKAISIWDGKRVFTVGHFEGSIRSYWNFRWSTEGKLAFIVTSS